MKKGNAVPVKNDKAGSTNGAMLSLNSTQTSKFLTGGSGQRRRRNSVAAKSPARQQRSSRSDSESSQRRGTSKRRSSSSSTPRPPPKSRSASAKKDKRQSTATPAKTAQMNENTIARPLADLPPLPPVASIEGVSTSLSDGVASHSTSAARAVISAHQQREHDKNRFPPLRSIGLGARLLIAAAIFIQLAGTVMLFSPFLLRPRGEEFHVVLRHVPTLVQLQQQHSAPYISSEREQPKSRALYRHVLNQTAAALDAVLEAYHPRDALGLLQMVQAYHYARFRTKLYARSREDSMLNQWFLYPVHDAWRYGIARHGLQRTVAELVSLRVLVTFPRRLWDTMTCLQQSEILPCPSLAYVMESFESTQGYYPHTGSSADMRHLLAWLRDVVPSETHLQRLRRR